MSPSTCPHKRLSTLPALACAIACGSALVFPQTAHADLADDLQEKNAELNQVQAEIRALSDDLEIAQDEYNSAVAQHDRAQAAVDAMGAEIAKTQSQIEDLQDRISRRVKVLYRNGSDAWIALLIDSQSFEELFDNIMMLNHLNDQDAKQADELEQAKATLETQQEILARSEHAAREALDTADAVKLSVEDEMEELQDKIDGLSAEKKEILGYMADEAGGSYVIADIPAQGDVVDYALSRKGCPYVWGGSGPSSFDCSGLVMWSYAQIGIDLPHNSEAQYAAADAVLPLAAAEPGDVLYRPGHVGICTSYGAKSYVHAPTFGAAVRDTDDISWSGFTCALRFS